MNPEIPSVITGSLVVAFPLILASAIYLRLTKKGQKSEIKSPKSYKVFGIVYFPMQFYMTVACILEGMQATGMEDVPAWGMSAFTTWGSGLVFLPIVGLIAAYTFKSYSKKSEPNH